MNDGNTFSYGELVEEGQRRLAAAGVEEAAVDAWLLFSYDKKVDRTWYLLNRTQRASGEEQEVYLKLIARRCERVPLQHITGEQEFMGLPFRVTPDVLIPRQDTEVLVEECLRHLAPGNIFLDLCTGSGCILVSLLHYAKGTFGTGADLSGKALAVAKGNVEANGVEARLVQGDLFEPVTGTFDLIVSNPPYIASAEIETLAPEVREHEPRGRIVFLQENRTGKPFVSERGRLAVHGDRLRSGCGGAAAHGSAGICNCFSDKGSGRP